MSAPKSHHTSARPYARPSASPVTIASTRLRAPRARIDPIVDAEDALSLIELVIADPRRNETIAFLLDDARRGLGCIVVVSDTDDPDAVLTVADTMAEVALCHDAESGGSCSLVIASIRSFVLSDPGDDPDDDPDGDPDSQFAPDDRDDLGRWLDLSDLTEDRGLLVREWFVIDPDGVHCPRELCGEPDRWSC